MNKNILTIFITNFLLMVIELTASRMIAPYVGSSLYTWTSMIGIILLGVSIGNLYGGRLADKHASERLIARMLWAAGITTLLTPLFVHSIGKLAGNAQNHYLLQTLAVCLIYLLPSFVIGTISPVIAKLSLKSLKETGNTIGRLYATGAIGSIVGTYITGFILITLFGLQIIIIGIAIIFFLTSFLFNNPLKLFSKYFGVVIVLALFLGVVNLNPAFACYKNTNYYCIDILSNNNNPSIRYLKMDQLMHSASDINDPTHLEFGYTKLIGTFAKSLPNKPANVLFLGGGGYTLPRYFISEFTNSSIDVVEIDPEVTKIAYQYFDAPKSDQLRTFNTDARVYLNQINLNSRYDIIVMDVFSDASVPSHLTTKNFNQSVKRRLNENGYFSANIIDTFSPGFFI